MTNQIPSLVLNIDLFSVGIITAAIIVLGFVLFFSNRKSTTNKIFLLLSLSISFWSFFNYLSYTVHDVNIATWSIKMVMFSAVFFALFLLLLSISFPKIKYSFNKKFVFTVLGWTIPVSLITLTPSLIKNVSFSPSGNATEITTSWGLFPFSATVIVFLIASLFIFIKKIRQAEKQTKQQLQIVSAGFGLTFLMLIFFNFIMPAFWNNSFFIPFGAFFVFPFVISVAYAILKKKLFNIKVGGISLLIFALTIVTFGEIIFADKLFLVIYRSSIFLLTLIIGIFLIRSVIKEVQQREKIEKLASELEMANQEQQNLISFITHQVKGFITTSRNIFAGLLEKDYGQIPDQAEEIIEEGFKSDTKAIETVQEILQASNLRKGTVEMKNDRVDLRELVQEEIAKQKKIAGRKGLTLASSVPEHGISIEGDKSLLEHVVHNLIDNAVKYTLKGSVEVSLKDTEDMVRFSVKDTGVGITPEDMKRLFTEGGRGKESQKVNVQSTGYGLFIVKNIVEKHGGKVWAESSGEGKGSEFIVNLPVGTVQQN